MYLACSSESSVRWASKFGRCRLATYSSAGKHTRHTGPEARHQVAVLSNSRTAATCIRTVSWTVHASLFQLLLTHLLGQQVHILLVSTLRSVEQLDQGQGLQTTTVAKVFGLERTTAAKARAPKRTNLSCSSDGQHKRRHRGAAQVKEASLGNEKRCDGATVKHNKGGEQDSRRLPGGRHVGDSDNCRLIRSQKLL